MGRPQLEVRSAGTERDADNPLSSEDIQWADLIMVMEKRHKSRIQNRFGTLCRDKRIVVLGLRDDYSFMQPELVALLENKVSRYLP